MAYRKTPPDPPARSAELLRLALPLMSRQAAGVHPVSYAVWYEHLAGRHPAMSQAIASLTADGRLLDDDATHGLYEQHLAGVDEQTAHRVAEGFRRVLADMAESTRSAGTQTARFDESLGRWAGVIESGGVPDAAALAEVLSHTRDMGAAVATLSTQLQASQLEIARLRDEVDRARDEALVDALTGLANRRAFELRMKALAAQEDAAHCLLVTDIDHFKKVNDTYGHLFGDQVLRVVAQAVKGCVAEHHVAARVGGEEFAVLLPGSDVQQAHALAERIRGTIAASRIRRKDSQASIGQITVSLGVAARRPGERTDDWFERADQALYASKQAGRNRVTLAAL